MGFLGLIHSALAETGGAGMYHPRIPADSDCLQGPCICGVSQKDSRRVLSKPRPAA